MGKKPTEPLTLVDIAGVAYIGPGNKIELRLDGFEPFGVKANELGMMIYANRTWAHAWEKGGLVAGRPFARFEIVHRIAQQRGFA